MTYRIMKFWLILGWKDIKSISKTIPYDVWELKTTKYSIKAADNHIVFFENFEEVFVKDLKPGEFRELSQKEVQGLLKLCKKTEKY